MRLDSLGVFLGLVDGDKGPGGGNPDRTESCGIDANQLPRLDREGEQPRGRRYDRTGGMKAIQAARQAAESMPADHAALY